MGLGTVVGTVIGTGVDTFVNFAGGIGPVILGCLVIIQTSHS
jgi:hypothetical protein